MTDRHNDALDIIEWSHTNTHDTEQRAFNDFAAQRCFRDARSRDHTEYRARVRALTRFCFDRGSMPALSALYVCCARTTYVANGVSEAGTYIRKRELVTTSSTGRTEKVHASHAPTQLRPFIVRFHATVVIRQFARELESNGLRAEKVLTRSRGAWSHGREQLTGTCALLRLEEPCSFDAFTRRTSRA